MELKRVGPWSAGRVCGAVYAVMGLIFGLLFACAAVVNGMMTRNSDGVAFGAGFGVGAIVVFPILYGVLGVVFGALTAWLYNVFAGMVGGIEVQLEPSRDSAVP
jgi:transmembrane protein DUF3566